MAFLSTLVLLDFFIVSPQLEMITSTLSSWVSTITAFILVIGVFNVYYHHYRVVKRREHKRWYFSAWVIFLISVMMLYGLAVGGAYTPEYQWFWFHLSAWAYASTLTVQGLFQVSAGYRAFRARSFEASLLFLSAIITILGYAPLSGTAIPMFRELAVWMTNNPSAAANRGITIGAGIGALAVSFRILLGRERHTAGEARGE